MKYFLLLSLVALSACAQPPENIAAVEVAGDPYGRYSCRKLKAEHVKVSQELEAVSAEQERAVDGDVLGVFLLGLPLSSMSGNDREVAVAVTKGRINALETKIGEKNCS